MPLSLPEFLLINLTDPYLLGAGAIAVVLLGYVAVQLRREQPSSSPAGGNAGTQDVAQARRDLQERLETASDGPKQAPSVGPGKGRSLREMAAHEEINESELLSRFVVNAKGDTVGETVALEPEQVVLKKEGAFYAVSLDDVIEKDGMLLVDAKIDWAAAEAAGETWREQAYDEMEYDDSGMPVVDK